MAEANKLKSNARFLIVRPDAIGDMVLTLPAIKAIKQTYPSSTVIVLSSAITKDLIKHLPFIDEVIVDRPAKGIRGFFKYVKWMRSLDIDCAIHFYSEPKTVWAAYFSGISMNLGDKAKLGLWPVLRKHGLFYRSHDQPKHVVHYNFLLLKPLGIRFHDDVSLRIDPPAEGVESAQRLLSRLGYKGVRPLIGIHLGVGGGNRPLTPQNYAQYINNLSQALDCDIVITGSTPQEHIFKEELKALIDRQIMDAVGKTNIPTLAGLLSLLTVYVGVDTGPSHLASALGRPQLAIFPSKRVKPLSWGPINNRHFLIRNANNCRYFCPHEGCPYTVCCDDISTQDMVQKTLQLLNGEGIDSYKDQRTYWFVRCMNIVVLYNDATKPEADAFSKELKSLGFYVICKHLTDPSLFETVVQHDISVLHNTTQKHRFALGLLSQKANPKLHNPPLVFSDPLDISRVFQHLTDDDMKRQVMVTVYCDAFQKKKF